MDTQPTEIKCASCNTLLTGNYCYNCGEKKLNPAKDFSLRKFIEQTVDGFTHLDSKFFKSFWLLLTKPGFLTAEYLNGRRVKYMKPIQILLITSVLFYFFMPNSGSFYSSYNQLNNAFIKKGFTIENFFKYNISKTLKEKAITIKGSDASTEAINQKSNEIYEAAYEKAAHNSKTWLFLILPVWALFVYLLFYRRHPYYVQHLVFAMHLFSFFLLTDMVFLVFYFDILGLHLIETLKHLLPFLIIALVYFIVAVKKVYLQSTVNAIWKGLIVYLLLLFLIVLYRTFITQWTIYSM
ncbi:MAG: DUF3667 domain-containing protein [Sphingobacteriales bacterium]|nr:DUF3667 domain-containing protein [Sphingobacteriales bacterium]